MARRIFLGLLFLVVFVIALALWVGLSVSSDLEAARETLGEAPAKLAVRDVRAAQDHLESASRRLDGVAAKLLSVVPVVNVNLGAARAVTDEAHPVLATALELRERADRVQDAGVLEDGRVRIEDLQTLVGPLEREAQALRSLHEAAAGKLGGWLLPPVHNALDELEQETAELLGDVNQLSGTIAAVPDLLGANEKKKYLILLLNNAELRGAGGILAGVGTLNADEGRLRLGAFTSVHALRTTTKKKVPVPPDYRRFVRVGANDTSLWLNTSYSPDVTDVATVASRMYEEVTGTRTDGAIAIDPRGLAALMPEDEEITVPGVDHDIDSSDLPEFVYSRAYDEFNDQQRRREVLLEVGARAFALILKADFDDDEAIEKAAEAFSGGHIRIVSFDERTDVLQAAGITGDFAPLTNDGVFVSVQNAGGAPRIGSKMDYWAQRLVAHQCRVEEERAECVTRVQLANNAPEGLDDYVTGSVEPYGLLRSNLEIYIPAAADLGGVEKDGESVTYFTARQADRQSIMVSVAVPRGERAEVAVSYSIALDEAGYRLDATPQPLARDARLEIALSVPDDWSVLGPGEREGDVWRHDETWEGPVSITATPDRRTGIPALWDALTDFWREPLL